MATLSEDNGVKRDKWLRRTKREKGIRIRLSWSAYYITDSIMVKKIYRAEKEQNDNNQSTQPTHNGTPKNATSSNHRGILSLFSDMTRSIESNEDTGRGKIGKAPIPAWGSTGAVVRGHKSVVSRTEAPSVDDADGKPDHVQQEVEKYHGRGEVKNPAKVFCYYSLEIYHFPGWRDIRGRKLITAASASKTSVHTHCTARNFTSLGSVGKSKLKTVISYHVSFASETRR